MALHAISERAEFSFGAGGYDTRGWPVHTEPGDERVGTVHDVLVDDDGRTRYLDIELDGSDRHVLLPSGQAISDESDRVVRLPGLTRNTLSELPPYRHDRDTLDREYERRLTAAYESAYTGPHYYAAPEYTAGWSPGRTTEMSGEIAPIGELDDVKVARGEHDPRGWIVEGSDGRDLGKVSDLIADTGAMRVRYLVMDVNTALSSDARRRVLVPAGYVALDDERERVRVDALDAETIPSVPAYEGGRLDRDFETRLGRFYAERFTGERHYEHPRYRSERLYGMHAAGIR